MTNRWIASYDGFNNGLKHHGIKGQRWGDKNGPPYPLDEKEHKEVVNRSRPGGKTRDKTKTEDGKGVSVNKKEAAQHTPVKPASGRDENFKKVYSKPGSFTGPSSGETIPTGTKEQYQLDPDDVNNVIEYDGSYDELIGLLILVGFDEDNIAQLVQIAKQKGGKLTVDESGYIPGMPFSIFKEFRDDSEKIFPYMSIVNDNESKPKPNSSSTDKPEMKDEPRKITKIDEEIKGKKHVIERNKKLIKEVSANIKNKDDAERLQRYKNVINTKKKEIEALEKERRDAVEYQKRKDAKLVHCAIYEYDPNSLCHYGRIGMKWGQHIFAKDPAKGRRYIDKKRKALSANVALARDAARRGNVKLLNKVNARTKKMTADVKQLEEMYEQATGQKYSSGTSANTNNAEAERQAREESKQTILKTGSAKDVFAIKDQLTQSEMQDAINRIQKETQLAQLKNIETQAKIERGVDFTKTLINAGNTAVNAFNTYENVAKMVNAITGEDNLPIFTGRKEAEKKEEESKRKAQVNKIMRSGSAKEICDNLHLFTNSEVEEVKKRLQNEAAIIKTISHSDDCLQHYGRIGMKWGQHIFGKDPLNKSNSKNDAEEFVVGITHLTSANERFWRESIRASDLSRVMNVSEGLKSGELSHLRRLERPNGKINNDDLGTVNYNRNHNPSNPGQTADTINDPGLNNNCGKCSASLFLRSLGYDVQAGRSAYGVLNTAGEYWFDGAVPYKEKSIENLEKRMASFGHQGKGMLGCRRADGSGHSIYFQNEKDSNGKWSTVIYDGQIGRKYNSVKELFDAESFDDTQFSRITNLTNATPNWDHLTEDSVARVNYTNKSLNVVQNIKTGKIYDANKITFT